MTTPGLLPNLTIRAVFFDAVGTLIHVQPSAAEVYAQVGGRFGSRLDVAEVSRRFRHFFQIEEDADLGAGLATSEERERRRWQNIVAGVLDDVADPQGCFAALYEHFSRPDAWRCDPAAETMLRELRDRGLKLGLASNYDHRLHSVAAGLPPLGLIDHLVISAEVGWRKPAAQFFAALCRTVDLPGECVLYVGDDPVNDFAGATGSGLPALLLDPSDRHVRLGPGRLNSLAELLQLLPRR